jgi:gliding motility-associated-like protein
MHHLWACRQIIVYLVTRIIALMRTLLLLALTVFIYLVPMCQLLSNYDTCRTQLYYQTIGSSSSNIHIEKGRTVQDHGIVNAGHIKQGGNQDAIVIKQNKNGEVIWQKEYGNAQYDEQFTDWRELPNRQLLMGGVAKNRITQQVAFFMMLLTADGNIIWQKAYTNVAAASNITNAKVYSDDYYGELFFAVETDSSIVYGITNNLGTLNWQRAINTRSGTKLVSAVAHYRMLHIAANSIDSGFRVTNFYYIPYYLLSRPTTIDFTVKLGGAHQNSHCIMHDYEHDDLYTHYSGIRSVNNAPYEVIRANIKSGYIREALETIVTPGVAINALSRTAINLHGDAVSFTTGQKNDRLHAIQLTPNSEIATYVIGSASYTLPDSVALGGNIKTWDQGYVFFGHKELPSGHQSIVQLKTDSAFQRPGCIAGQRPPFSVVRNLFPADTVTYSYNNLHGLIPFNYSAMASNVTVDTLILCKELKCPSLPLSDSCLDSYQKLYKSYDNTVHFNHVQVINGRTFVGGNLFTMGYVVERAQPFIAEMNGNGQVINQKKYMSGIGTVARMFKTRDSCLLLYGFSGDSAFYPALFVAKIDTNLNVIWMRSLRVAAGPQYAPSQTLGEVTQGSDGSYFILYSDDIAFNNVRMYLVKLDATGNYLWSKMYRASDPGASNFIRGVKLEVGGGNVYIVCQNAYSNYASSILIKATENNGNLVWCKKYASTGAYAKLTDMISLYNNELLIGGQFRNIVAENYRNVLLKTNTDGAIVSAVSFTDPTTNMAPTMRFLHAGNGNVYMNGVSFSPQLFSNPHQMIVKVNNNFDIAMAKKRPSILYNEGNALAVGTGGQLFEAGAYYLGYNYSSLPYLLRFSPDGRAGTCPSDTMVLQKVNVSSLSVTDVPCVESDSFFVMRTPVNRTEQFFLATTKLVCASVPGCNSLDVTGADTICDRSVAYTFRAIRNSGCAAPLQWLYDNSNVQVLAQTDSTITLRFMASGQLLLQARFTSGCIDYIDSLRIYITGNGPVLNLGTDTVLCNGNSLLLNAKKGFLSYRWQDGSTDSVLTVTTPGLYHVTVTDLCGNLYSDSVRVLPDNPLLFDLGPTTAVCRGDSVSLSVAPGLTNYTWWPQVNILSQGPSATVFPVMDTWYQVAAIKPTGCRVIDSVLITLYPTPIINLGPDTSICRGDTVVLNASPGFSSYAWSTGAQTASVKIYQAGLYYIAATDINGCVAKDSFSIRQLYPLPVTQLPNDTFICRGQSTTLFAGTGFNSYLWSNGALTDRITVSSTGLYWVTVANSFGCRTTDSVLISRELATPTDFIKDTDSTICSFESLTIGAATAYRSYLWNNGSTAPTITINNPGTYWLRVTDNNGCIGSDTFMLATKNCNIGVYFPTGFTPNRDGLNDTYKPRAYGIVGFYRIFIYNRYGQKVFESYNINDGWNGEFMGVPQEPGTYVWHCWYRLGAASMQQQSGTMVLLR